MAMARRYLGGKADCERHPLHRARSYIKSICRVESELNDVR